MNRRRKVRSKDREVGIAGVFDPASSAFTAVVLC